MMPSEKKEKRINNRKPTELQQKIINTKQAHPRLNTVEIAAVANCDHTHVVRTLQRYGIAKFDVDNFISNRAAIFAGLQHRLLSSLTDDDIKKTPLGSRVLAAAQLYDKERLETGKTTSNLAIVQFQMPAPDPVPDELKNVKVEDINAGGIIDASAS
jgi:hypothetical protein